MSAVTRFLSSVLRSGSPRRPRAALALAVLPMLAAGASAGAGGSWSDAFDRPGLTGRVFGLGTYNGDLIAGGDGFAADGAYTNNVARFDGQRWHRMGGGFGAPFSIGATGVVRDAVEFQGELVACGAFYSADGLPARGVARWNGTQWSPLGAGLELSFAVVPEVFALEVFQGELYAAGRFDRAGGQTIVGIARWDGATWRDVGGSFASSPFPEPRALVATATDLYVAGSFAGVGGVSAPGVARWDGTAWHGLGSGIFSGVHALEWYGGELVAGGVFSTAGGVPAKKIARWNGTTWSAFGTGVPDTTALTHVDALEVFAGDLYAGGFFHSADGATSRSIVRWDGTSFLTMGGVWGSGNTTTVLALQDWNGRLIVGGEFSRAGGYPAVPGQSVVCDSILGWDGSAWSTVGTGLGCDGTVRDLVEWSGGVVVVGDFLEAGGEYTPGLAFHDGTGLTFLAEVSGTVRDAVVYQGDLVISGSFTAIDGQPFSRVARFDGTTWSGFGSGFEVGFGDPVLEVYAGQLHAGGLGLPRRWTGTTWQTFGSDVAGVTNDLHAHGGLLYIGGSFNVFPWDTGPRNVASWDGTSLAHLGGGLDDAVYCLASEGSDLLVGGEFAGEVGGAATGALARWNGTWSTRAAVTGTTVKSVAFLRGELYAGGDLIAGVDDPRDGLARWNGADWEALDGGIVGEPLALLARETRGELWAGGQILRADGAPSVNLARWTLDVTPIGDSVCNGDGGDQLGCTDCPCGNAAAPGTPGGCLNSGGSGTLLGATGSTSVSLPPGSSGDLRITAASAPPQAFCILLSGDAVAPVGPANPCAGSSSGVTAVAYDGLRCAVGTVRRHGSRTADALGDVGSTTAPWGGEGGPAAGLALSGAGFVPGQTRYFQIVHRDDPQAVCLRGLNTSQAVGITFQP